MPDFRKMRTEQLTSIQQQIRCIQRIHAMPQLCPNCRTPVDVYTATGTRLEDEDGRGRPNGKCPACGRGLILCVPFISIEPYVWQLVPEIPQSRPSETEGRKP